MTGAGKSGKGTERAPAGEHRADLLARIRRLCAPLEPLPTGRRPRLPSLPGIRAVLFDVYGTLLVSGSGEVGTAGARDNAEALGEALRAAGLPAGEVEKTTPVSKVQRQQDCTPYVVTAAGRRHNITGRRIPLELPSKMLAAAERAVAAAHERGRRAGVLRPEVEILEIWAQVLPRGTDRRALERLAVEYECRVNPTWPMPGAREALAALRAAGLVTGIVSNAQFYTPLVMEALLGIAPGGPELESRYCAWSHRLLRAKPCPEMFAGVLARLRADHGIAPGEVLYVGNDMLNDVWGARQVGCRAALFAGDRRSLRLRRDDERCAGLEPDAVLTRLEQVTAVVG